MLDIIGSIFGAIAGGGITGLLGSAFTAYTEYKKQKLAFEHDERMVKLEQETMKMEWEGRVKVSQTEYEGKKDVAEVEAFGESFKADRATYLQGTPQNLFSIILFTIVDFCRGMMRPSMTAYLCIVVTWLAYKVYNLVGGAGGLDQTQAYALFQQMIFVILYITTTVILWWFGTRNKLFNKTI